MHLFSKYCAKSNCIVDFITYVCLYTDHSFIYNNKQFELFNMGKTGKEYPRRSNKPINNKNNTIYEILSRQRTQETKAKCVHTNIHTYVYWHTFRQLFGGVLTHPFRLLDRLTIVKDGHLVTDLNTGGPMHS